MGGWHTSNLFITSTDCLVFVTQGHGLTARRYDRVVSITFAYSFLLHIHLHFWAQANGRGLTKSENVRAYLSYVPTLFLPIAIWTIWNGAYAPMLTKLNFFVLPFALWIFYVLGLIAVTELLIARKAPNRSEQGMKPLRWSSLASLSDLAPWRGLGVGTTAGFISNNCEPWFAAAVSMLAYYIPAIDT